MAMVLVVCWLLISVRMSEFRVKLIITRQLRNIKDQSVDNEVNIKYLDIPVLLSLNTNKMAAVNLNAVVGPQFGINVGSDISSSGSTATATATVAAKKGDIGAAFGAGLEFALN